MRTSFHHQSEAQSPNGPLTAATSPDTPSPSPTTQSHANRDFSTVDHRRHQQDAGSAAVLATTWRLTCANYWRFASIRDYSAERKTCWRRKLSANRSPCFFDRLLALVPPNQVTPRQPRFLALTCRWRSRPQHQKRSCDRDQKTFVVKRRPSA